MYTWRTVSSQQLEQKDIREHRERKNQILSHLNTVECFFQLMITRQSCFATYETLLSLLFLMT